MWRSARKVIAEIRLMLWRAPVACRRSAFLLVCPQLRPRVVIGTYVSRGRRNISRPSSFPAIALIFRIFLFEPLLHTRASSRSIARVQWLLAGDAELPANRRPTRIGAQFLHAELVLDELGHPSRGSTSANTNFSLYRGSSGVTVL